MSAPSPDRRVRRARAGAVRRWFAAALGPLGRGRLRASALLVVAALGPGLVGPAVVAHAATGAPTPGPVAAEQTLTVPVGPEPDGSPVDLDASVFAPAGTGRHPAVLLAHGFGGSKSDLAPQASDLEARGFVVLTYTARGFGASGGRIHLDDPDYEVADARRLVDLLASRDDVRLDAAGDPRVAVVGGSYGGALALMAAASDPRIDTVVALITWNDLADAFFPQNVTSSPSATSPAQVEHINQPGPFKQIWASRFFASAVASAPRSPTGPPSVCGRFDPAVCKLFLAATETGQPAPELLSLLHAHSPRPTLGALKAPTYLVQGMADSLFGLDQSDATARALQAGGTPVAVRWMDGGHDGMSSTAAADEESVRTWLTSVLLSEPAGTVSATLPVPAFAYAAPLPRGAQAAPVLTAPAYVGSATWSTLPPGSASTPKPVLAPPGGQPASVTLIPGLGGLSAGVAAYQLAALPGQFAAFDSAPVAQRTTIVGAPRARLTVVSSGSSATFYLSLWQVDGGVARLPRRLVSPVTVATTAGVPTTVDVALPAATMTLEVGSVARVLVTSTDSAYSGPRAARVDSVQVVDGSLSIPTVAGAAPAASGERDLEAIAVAAATALALLLLGGTAWWQRRRRQHLPVRDDLADVPLVIDSLVKTYADGHRAVDDVTWRADRGQVVGLLGPNGAGKTTTLRMVMGLIEPDSGTVHVLGQPIRAGAPVLSRVGALIEGPGFLPHLTGMQNLHAYWAATGRAEGDACYDEVLDVAALGDAIDRPVRSYSHGMRQRLGIAQAMLGMPAVLVLDEPTNGLDPPQIAAMRPILHRYAAQGRTVVVSSHLLGEVEMTCSHVVVMHAGRVVTAGTVAELVDSADTTVLQLGPGSDAVALAARLARVEGITGTEVVDDPLEPRLTVTADLPRTELVRMLAGWGADIVGVTSRRHLEEVFLGVIAQAGAGGSDHAATRSLTDRLRQVRSR